MCAKPKVAIRKRGFIKKSAAADTEARCVILRKDNSVGVAIGSGNVQRGSSIIVLCIHISTELLNEGANGFDVTTRCGSAKRGFSNHVPGINGRAELLKTRAVSVWPQNAALCREVPLERGSQDCTFASIISRWPQPQRPNNRTTGGSCCLSPPPQRRHGLPLTYV